MIYDCSVPRPESKRPPQHGFPLRSAFPPILIFFPSLRYGFRRRYTHELIIHHRHPRLRLHPILVANLDRPYHLEVLMTQHCITLPQVLPSIFVQYHSLTVDAFVGVSTVAYYNYCSVVALNLLMTSLHPLLMTMTPWAISLGSTSTMTLG